MKFRCTPTYPNLHVIGVGRFVEGILEVDGDDAVERLLAIDSDYGIEAIPDGDGPFDPTTHVIDDVRDYLHLASAEELERVIGVEQGRADREPRKGVLELTPAPPSAVETPAG